MTLGEALKLLAGKARVLFPDGIAMEAWMLTPHQLSTEVRITPDHLILRFGDGSDDRAYRLELL